MVLTGENREIKIKMDRRREARRGFNELMSLLTTRCLVYLAQTADEIINKHMNK